MPARQASGFRVILIIAALQVVNSFNVKVEGTTTGIAVAAVPNVGALSAASNTAGAATKSAETPTSGGQSDRASVFIVEVVGYGGGEGSPAATTSSGATPSPGETASPEEDTKKRDSH